MNWIVITFGVLLVMVLSAAMVGPFFVDWTAYRATLEANAERVLGTNVTIGGEADVRLLPSPRIRVTNVRLGPPQAPLLEAASVELDVDLAPLVRGEFKVRDLRLEAPTVYARVDDAGALVLPQFAGEGPFLRFFDAEDMEVGSIAVTDGQLLVDDARDGARHRLSDVALTGNARTLRGPFQATGSFRAGGRLTAARIAGGALDADGKMALSVRLAPEGESFAIGFEGALSASSVAPSLAGRLNLTALEGARPWQVNGDLALAAEGAAVTGLTVTYGTVDRALTLSGSALYAFADADPLSVRLEAEQLDLDRVDRGLANEDTAAPRPPVRTMGALRTHFAPAKAALDRLVGWGMPTALQVDVGTLVVGGALVNDVTLAATTDAAGLSLEHGEALLPGDAAVHLRGRLARGGFDGRLTLSAPQPALLARWWTGGAAPVVVMNPVHLQADIGVLPGVVSVPDLSFRMGETTLAGHGRIAVPEAGAVTSADLSLSAPFVDVADVEAAVAFLSSLGVDAARDVAIGLDIAVDRLRAGPVEGETVSLNADYGDDRLTVDALIVEDFGGMEVFASGAIAALSGDPVGSIEGTVTVRSGAALANVIETLFPQGPRTDVAVAMARHLAPGTVNVALAG
ncbi:MAG: AsmA family protein, partial [Pseudomonadota bacterium]